MMPSLVRLLRLRRFNSRRSRRLVFAGVATLFVATTFLGIIGLIRWQAAHAVHGDTSAVLNQATTQLVRAVSSRRGTLTLLRDTLDRAAGLTTDEQRALAKSAVIHTRHLIGIGLVRSSKPTVWWAQPSPTTSKELYGLGRAISLRTRLSNVWRNPSTFTVFPNQNRPFLVMLEPLRAKSNQSSALIGVFDLKAMLSDFFELTLQQPYPVQVFENDQILYRSPRWQDGANRRTTLEQSIRLDMIRWTVQMQPGTTQAARAISSFRMLLVAFIVMVGVSLIGLIWLLAMRTWFLQRAVSRRTAALRRTTERLRQLAITDELTGLYNRRFFLDRWQWEYDRAKRYERPLGCLMIDINHFKKINDLLGHHVGDQVLKQVAQELNVHLRQSDILARFGGDEFIVALPETTDPQATTVAEKLRSLAIQGTWMQAGKLGPVSLSVGLSHLHPDDSAQDVIQKADAALYASRRIERGIPIPQPSPSHS